MYSVECIQVSAGSAFSFVVIDGSITAGRLVAADMGIAHAILTARHPNAEEIHIRRLQTSEIREHGLSLVSGRN